MDRRRFCAGLLAAAWGANVLEAEEAAETPAAAPANEFDFMALINKTGGGKQFWADVWFFHDWRIQCHALTNHYRLLDGSNHRHASGTFAVCRDKLDEVRQRDKLPPMSGKAVILIHGLFRTRSAMHAISKTLRQDGGFSTFCMGYPTTRGTVDSHARSLDSVVRSLEEMSEIHFVAHSLGNLVVRHWLTHLKEEQRSLPKHQTFGRMVMLAPPNRQPQIATTFIRGTVANFVAGPAAQQLATGWDGLEPKLATPHFEFGVLAGGRGDSKGYNPLLPGDDDGVITVESTRLPGARDFRVLPVMHTFFMDDRRAQELTLRFLTEGHFESVDKRQPIEKD
jgi:predicted alpha/beta hydrolase family esterase